MAYSNITVLPDAPQRTDEPAVFSAKADAHVLSLSTFVTEVNAAGAYFDSVAVDVAADLVLTNADVVLTGADLALTNADVVLTGADLVLTNADVISSQDILDSNVVIAAAVQAAAGLPSLSGNAGKPLTANPGEDGVEWGEHVGIVLLATVNASASSTATFDGEFSADYDEYIIIATSIELSATATIAATIINDSSTELTAGYYYTSSESTSLSTSHQGYIGQNVAAILLTGAAMASGASYGSDIIIRIRNPLNTSSKSRIDWEYSAAISTSGHREASGGANHNTADGMQGIKLAPDAGTFTGDFRLYGVKK